MRKARGVKTILFAVMLGLAAILSGCSHPAFADANVVTASELHRLMAGGTDIVIVDLRAERNYMEEHIPGAISIPADEIDDRFPAYKTGRLVIYCFSDGTSRAVSSGLGDPPNISVLEGGIYGWKALGFDTERGGVWSRFGSITRRAKDKIVMLFE
ncbi:MAG: rhodanese-like domain-containing protein [Nitrospirae bacterium]|nr:rhodanese-like domain-containing protein [Nitrospirota bacterium]